MWHIKKLIPTFCAFLLYSKLLGNAPVDPKIIKGDSIFESDPAQALSYFENLYEKNNVHEDSSYIAHLLDRIGKINMLLGNYSEAIRFLNKAVVFYEDLDRDSLLAEQFSNLGSAYYFSNILDQDLALEYYQKAYQLYDSLKLKRVAALNLNYSAYIYWAKEQKEKALQIHLKALHIFDSLKNLKGKAISTSDIGFTLNSMDRFEEGLSYNLKALRLAKTLDETLITIPILNNIGISYQGLGKLDSALKYSLKSKTIAESKNLNPRKSEALNTLHSTYALLNNYENAYHILLQYQGIRDSTLHKDRVRELIKLEYQLNQAKSKHQRELALENERHLKNILFITSIALLLILILFIWNTRNKFKNAKLISLKNEALKKMNHQNVKQIEEKNILIEEINHRIKNHFQMLSSLNRIMYMESSDERIQEIVNEINNRVHSMAQIYDQLNYSKTSEMDLKNYLTALSENLITSLEVKVKLELFLDHILLDIKRTVNIGVLITEMITNSIKHAFNQQNNPVIKIYATENNQHCIIKVMDNGNQMNKNLLDQELTSQGVGLIKLIANQMHAALSIIEEDEWNGWQLEIKL